MTYAPKAGDTFLIESGPSGKHLWVLLSDNLRRDHLLVSVVAWKPNARINDGTCVITPGDHPRIRRRSFIYYRAPLEYSTASLQHRVDTGYFDQQEPVENALLARVSAGFLASSATPRWAMTLWRTGVGVDEQSSGEVAKQFSWAKPAQPAPTEPDLTPARKLRAFLCHAKEDKAKILDLYHTLKGSNLEPWLDIYDIIPGQIWEEEIEEAIRSTDAFLVCLSNTSISKTGYVQSEIVKALKKADDQPDGKIFIIPVLLEDCQVPRRLDKIQYVDYFGPDGHRMLLKSLRHLSRWLNQNGHVVLDVSS